MIVFNRNISCLIIFKDFFIFYLLPFNNFQHIYIYIYIYIYKGHQVLLETISIICNYFVSYSIYYC